MATLNKVQKRIQDERNQKIFSLYQQGKKLQEIIDELHLALSRERVNQIIKELENSK